MGVWRKRDLLWVVPCLLCIALLVLYLCHLYTNVRDKRFYHFDEKAISWLADQPSTAEICMLAGLGDERPYFLYLPDLELTPAWEEDPGPKARWTATAAFDGVLTADLKANLCDECISHIALACGTESDVGYMLLWPETVTAGHGRFMAVKDRAWMWFDDAYYFHINQMEEWTYEVNLILTGLQ